jgi:hypothetical protein
MTAFGRAVMDIRPVELDEAMGRSPLWVATLVQPRGDGRTFRRIATRLGDGAEGI